MHPLPHGSYSSLFIECPFNQDVLNLHRVQTQRPETKGAELLYLNSSKGLSVQKLIKRTSFLKVKQTRN